MEKLNSDEKMSILMNLNGNEIIRVCSTSKSMARICSDERYSPLGEEKYNKNSMKSIPERKKVTIDTSF